MFPRPDVGVEDFPAPDAGFADFPGPDVGVEDFPPAPVMLVYADVAWTLTPAAVWAVLPWRTADAVFSMTPAAAPVVSVVLEAAAGLVMTPIAAIIPDELFPAVSITMTPAVEVEHAGVVEAPTGLSMFPGMAEVPVAVVTADAITTMMVTAAVEIAGVVSAGAGLTMSPTCAPAASISTVAERSFVMSPAGEDIQVITFLPSGMTKSGETTRFGTSFAQVTGWAADTANFPGSTVVDNDLISQTGGEGVTIQVSIEWRNNLAFGSRTITTQLRVNGTPVGSNTSPSIAQGASAVVAWSVPELEIPEGAAIRLEAQASGGNALYATNNPASYVRLVQP